MTVSLACVIVVADWVTSRNLALTTYAHLKKSYGLFGSLEKGESRGE